MPSARPPRCLAHLHGLDGLIGCQYWVRVYGLELSWGRGEGRGEVGSQDFLLT